LDSLVAAKIKVKKLLAKALTLLSWPFWWLFLS